LIKSIISTSTEVSAGEAVTAMAEKRESFAIDSQPELQGSIGVELAANEVMAVCRGSVFKDYVQVTGRDWRFTGSDADTVTSPPPNSAANDDAPQIQGAISIALTKTKSVHMRCNGVTMGVAMVDGTGLNWSFTDARGDLEADGGCSDTAQAINATSATGAESLAYVVHFDATAPVINDQMHRINISAGHTGYTKLVHRWRGGESVAR
jgi:hypothetical protein